MRRVARFGYLAAFGGWLGSAAAAGVQPQASPAAAPPVAEMRMTIRGAGADDDGAPLLAVPGPLRIQGSTDAPAESAVEVTVDGVTARTEVRPNGEWSVVLQLPPSLGTYTIEALVTAADGRRAQAHREVVVGRLPRRPDEAPTPMREAPERLRPEDFQESTDRWRLTPPSYELNAASAGRWDPYNQNRLKGDLPIRGDRLFLALTGVSDTLVEARTLPTPAGVSTAGTTIDFFGGSEQLFSTQNVLVSADLFHGDTAFRPVDWRVKGTLAGNFSYLRVRENGAVDPDVREGRARTDGRAAIEELFVEKKLRDLSPDYDFLSLRVGIQPFTSDFRGFLYSDINLGVRLFGNYGANRWQYNLAYFDQLEKDTNSGLNTLHRRDQQLAIANLYRQDFPLPGHTTELSIHYLRDGPSFHFDDNGFLVRPDPVGDFTPHRVEVTYYGLSGAGHFGRVNLDSSFFYARGRDSLNPIAGRELVLDPGGELAFREAVDVSAFFAAVELSYNRDWLRPRLALLWASGDGDLNDRQARGFDGILERPNFAGGGFSLWNRMGIKLAGTGVTLVNRGSFLPDLKSSREEGQPNFVNPGLELVSLGLDAKLTPKLEALGTANYLRFDRTEVLEGLLFQAPIDSEIGWDLSLGVRWRPLLNQNVVMVGGVGALLPGRGFAQIFERRAALCQGFASLALTF